MRNIYNITTEEYQLIDQLRVTFFRVMSDDTDIIWFIRAYLKSNVPERTDHNSFLCFLMSAECEKEVAEIKEKQIRLLKLKEILQ